MSIFFDTNKWSSVVIKVLNKHILTVRDINSISSVDYIKGQRLVLGNILN